MRIGSLTVKIMVRDARSLKDKRRVVRSLKDNIRNRHNVSAAEVGGLDSRQQAILGFAMAGNDGRYIEGALAKIVNYVRACPSCDLIDYDIEVF